MSWTVWLSPPEMSSVEREMLLAAFDSGWVAPAGPDLDAFERELCAFTGAAAVVGLSSGTAALHMALMAVGVGEGDEVLMSDLTFAASAFAATYLGARPVFVDSEPQSWQLDPELVEAELAARAARGTLPAAVVAVDLYGSVCDGTSIATSCARYGVPLVEDAAEALGAGRDGIMAGRFGRVGVLSFNGNKIVTTGGGGALVADDVELVDRVRHLSTQARRPVPWYEHGEVGYNYRLGNLNAAVGRGQLATLPARMQQRAAVRAAYERGLADVPGVQFQVVPTGCRPNHWLTTIELHPRTFGANSVEVLAALRAAGIEARHGFQPMHLQPVFAGSAPVTAGGTSVAARHFQRSVSLPSSGLLSGDDVCWIIDTVLSARH
ncbi:MAG: aminotransferase class I/II-fold pyridoxal phosphate-dependent enzyme [Actinomycetota bacterium]|nr:aminotransferase class I/II-fold pyridoxal phosphate-dependent enzyme [Actinomycetota bacterium]